MPNVVYDIIILALLALAVWRGYRKGLVLTVLGFLAIFVALIGASLLANSMAEPVADMVQPVVEGQIREVLDQALTDAGMDTQDDDGASMVDEIPIAGVVEALRESKLFAGLADSFENALDDGTAQMLSSAAESLAHYVAVQIAHGVLFGLSFVIILIVWAFLSHALDLVAKLPVLSALNAWGGAAVGILWGGLLLFAAAWVGLRTGLVTQEMLDDTVLLKFFCTTNPVDLVSTVLG